MFLTCSNWIESILCKQLERLSQGVQMFTYTCTCIKHSLEVQDNNIDKTQINIVGSVL